MASVWLIKLVLSHLVTDFILQPRSWVDDRNKKHFLSVRLYLHALVTALFAWIMTGWQYWPAMLVILITHLLIDGWKSYQKQNAVYFLIDQFLHLVVIIACWYFIFMQWKEVKNAWEHISGHEYTWRLVTGFVFLTTPAGILIGQLTRKWRDKIPGAENLANAGKWIGIIERVIILVFVLQSQFSAIGLLIAAKGIIRFNEKDRQEIKTEYLVIGTLMSIGIAIMTGLLIKA